MNKKAIVLFSGGCDCTLAAAQVAEQKDFNEIVLLTYEVPVSCLDENSKRNIPFLEKSFPDIVFTHEMIPVGNILNKVITKKKLQFVLKHGLIEASLCLHCRLAMHIRTIMYCIDNDIRHVFDGSNVTMALWVDQTRKGLEMVDQLYSAFGITAKHPVFYYAGDDLFDLVKYLGEDDLKNIIHKSTSHELHEMKIIQDKNHKSDYLSSYRVQPVCLGVVMSLAHSLGVNLPFKSYEKFNNKAHKWYRDKIGVFENLLMEYKSRRKDSELGKLIRPVKNHQKGRCTSGFAKILRNFYTIF